MQRQYIFGFGWVDNAKSNAVEAHSITVAGIVAANGGISVGLIQNKTTTIDPKLAGDAVVSVESAPFHLKVTATNTTEKQL